MPVDENEKVLWRKFQCVKCEPADKTTVVIRLWGFDRHGSLYFVAYCFMCGNNTTIGHTAEEIETDRQAVHNTWAEEYAIDKVDWELLEQEFDDGHVEVEDDES